MALTNAQRKRIRSLHTSKGRREENAFIVEGVKAVEDTLPFFECIRLIVRKDQFDRFSTMVPEDKIEVVSGEEMERLSELSSPSKVLAIYSMPANQDFDTEATAKHNLVLALSGVQDPGNLGTILRTALWFGIDHLLLSQDCVSLYNHKTVMSTMGALAHVKVYRCDLVTELDFKDKTIPIYGTYLEDSENLFKSPLSPNGVIVMGSEGQGISPTLNNIVTHRLHIPSFGDCVHPESLNVAAATAVIVSRFRSLGLK